MKRAKLKRYLESGEVVQFDVCADGCLETVDATVVCDDGKFVSIKYSHPIYYTPVMKVVLKKTLKLV